VGRALILSIQVAALGFAALRLVHPEIATSLRASRIDAPKNASRVRRYEVPISFFDPVSHRMNWGAELRRIWHAMWLSGFSCCSVCGGL